MNKFMWIWLFVSFEILMAYCSYIGRADTNDPLWLVDLHLHAIIFGASILLIPFLACYVWIITEMTNPPRRDNE